MVPLDTKGMTPYPGSVESIADRLREARVARGLGQAELSDLARLRSRTHVGQIERGQIVNPRRQTLQRLALALDVSYTWLAYGEGGHDIHPEARNLAAEMQGSLASKSTPPAGMASWPPPPDQDAYPGRAQVMRIALAKGVDSAAVDALLDLAPEGNPDHSWWMARLREMIQLANEVNGLSGAPEPKNQNGRNDPPDTEPHGVHKKNDTP